MPCKNKEYDRAYNKKYYLENAEKIKEARKKYRAENAEKIKANQKQYYAKNAEKIKDRVKEYRIRNIKSLKCARCGKKLSREFDTATTRCWACYEKHYQRSAMNSWYRGY